MVLRKIMGLFVCVLVLSSAALATAGIPDPDLTLASQAGIVNETVSLFNLPNGGGSSFANAQNAADGSLLDATINMVLRDAYGTVIADYPSEDMWLEASDGGLMACLGGASADVSTNAAGETRWATPLNAGGYSTGFTVVVVGGITLNQAPFNLRHNSADINGDGVVNLSDIGAFADVFFGVYDYKADFSADGVLNLTDVGRLATGSGAACP